MTRNNFVGQPDLPDQILRAWKSCVLCRRGKNLKNVLQGACQAKIMVGNAIGIGQEPGAELRDVVRDAADITYAVYSGIALRSAAADPKSMAIARIDGSIASALKLSSSAFRQ